MVLIEKNSINTIFYKNRNNEIFLLKLNGKT